MSALALGMAFAAVCGEVLGWAYFRLLGGELGRPVLEGRIGQYDPTLGYRLIPNAQARLHGPEFDMLIRTNERGFRQDRTVPNEKTPGMRRAVLLGDSYTYGHGVETHDRFGEKLESRFHNLEVVNLAMAGTGTDQQYLIYESDGIRYSPDLVILCYMVENIRRNGNDARLMPDGSLGPKPQFVLENGQLTLRNVPVPTALRKASEEDLAVEEFRSTGIPIPFKRLLQEHSYFYQFMRLRLADPLKRLLRSNPSPYPEYDESRPEWQVTTALFKRLATEAQGNGSDFLLVVIPTPEYMAMDWLDDRPHRMLAEFCAQEHLDCLDLLPGLLDASTTAASRLYYPLDGHWTPDGHSVAARLIGDYLIKHYGTLLTQGRGAERS